MNDVKSRMDDLYQQAARSVACWTDQMFAGLLVFQWLAGIGLACWLSPRAWSGTISSVHPHIWAALVLGGALISLPLLMIWRSPGQPATRYAVAIAQMLESALLIHLMGGRIEAHFHIFGSLAFLSFYRDWRVLATASAVVALEHYLRGAFWPESVYGTTWGSEWRWLEHAGWVGFIDLFLLYSGWKSRNEMWAIAERQAMLERTNESVEQKVRERTGALQRTEEALRRSTERCELAIRGSQDGIWDWNITSGEVFYAARFKELLEYEESEFPARFETFKSHLHPEDRAATVRAIQQRGTDGKTYDIVHRMRTKSGQWRWFRSRGVVIRNDQGKACRIAGSISDVTRLKSVETELLHAARIDKLTGLPNRALLLDRLQQALDRAACAKDRHVAIMFLDFDRFKIINDSLGHPIGDELLKEISDRIRQHVRTSVSVSRVSEGDTAARLGGDEFVVLLDNLRRPEDVLGVAARLLEAFARPYQIGSHEIFSTASIGIVMNNCDYTRAEDMLRDADTAMYEAKRTGKARYVVFDASMREHIQRRLRLENDLRKAIAAEQMFLVYQPIVSLETGSVSGVEALLRWRHPVEGAIGPVEFIPIAEDAGLILPIGEWVLREGCQQLARWQRSLGAAAPETMSINLSRKQFVSPTLTATIRGIIEDAGIAPGSVQLEITESACMQDLPSAIIAMEAIKAIGAKLAIDDFGTGYSSLASLQQFPIDVLKIDRSFINEVDTDQDTSALVHALTALARNLGIVTVAEGIEQPGQLAALREMGCEYAQGYYFAKPMAPEDVETLIVDSLRPQGLLAEALETAGA
jgi:diguanylate cyclase (GGDEF)-like protein/PAS domain S-box-containing protein